MRKKILLLGSGELGKEFVISMQRLGQYVIAVDNYENAPAMQVAHDFEVINMLNGDELDRVVFKHQPDFKKYIYMVDDFESIDVLIATGSNLTARYFNHKYAIYINKRINL